VQNESVRGHSSDLNRDELTLSHQPFNSEYECGSIKFTARSSLLFKIKFNRKSTAQAWAIMWPIGDFKFLLFNRHME
jgi:hypothetical protein